MLRTCWVVVRRTALTSPSGNSTADLIPKRRWTHVSAWATFGLITGLLAVAASLTGLLAPEGIAVGVLGIMICLIGWGSVRRRDRLPGQSVRTAQSDACWGPQARPCCGPWVDLSRVPLRRSHARRSLDLHATGVSGGVSDGSGWPSVLSRKRSLVSAAMWTRLRPAALAA